MNKPMSRDELLRWARIAAEAAGYNPIRDVNVTPSSENPELVSAWIGGHICEQVRFDDGGLGWDTGDETIESLAEALATILSQAAFEDVQYALTQAGLPWAGEPTDITDPRD